MPPDPPGTIDDAIAALETALAQHAPQTLANLNPGLTDDEIDAALAGTGLALPEELRALYRWRDGSGPAPARAFRPFFANSEFITLAHSVPVYQQLQSAPPHIAYMKSWLDVFPDPMGDGIKHDLSPRTPQGAWFDVFIEDSQYTYYPSLKSILVMVAEGFRTGVFKEDAAGEVQTDFFALLALQKKYGVPVR